jgi:hypothetical protein
MINSIRLLGSSWIPVELQHVKLNCHSLNNRLDFKSHMWNKSEDVGAMLSRWKMWSFYCRDAECSDLQQVMSTHRLMLSLFWECNVRILRLNVIHDDNKNVTSSLFYNTQQRRGNVRPINWLIKCANWMKLIRNLESILQ